jgi:hypothetical protein
VADRVGRVRKSPVPVETPCSSESEIEDFKREDLLDDLGLTHYDAYAASNIEQPNSSPGTR